MRGIELVNFGHGIEKCSDDFRSRSAVVLANNGIDRKSLINKYSIGADKISCPVFPVDAAKVDQARRHTELIVDFITGSEINSGTQIMKIQKVILCHLW